jgi:hypothetical protein
MRKPKRQLGPECVTQVEQEIQWQDYDRIEPGAYPAYCRWAKRYFDRGFKRWTCLLRFDVLSSDFMQVIARVPMWLNLGAKDKPHAGRRRRYFAEWVRANGGAPHRTDRLSPDVFTRRIARVEVADTKSDAPYSKVSKILSWETGGSLSHLVTQSRTASVKAVEVMKLEGANGREDSVLAGAEGDDTLTSHTQGADVPSSRRVRQRQGRAAALTASACESHQFSSG